MIRTLSAIGILALLGAGLTGCGAPAAGPSGWAGPAYRPGYYGGYPGYYGGGPAYYPRHYRADRYRALPPRWSHRPERNLAPRREQWSQDQLRRSWCTLPGATC